MIRLSLRRFRFVACSFILQYITGLRRNFGRSFFIVSHERTSLLKGHDIVHDLAIACSVPTMKHRYIKGVLRIVPNVFRTLSSQTRRDLHRTVTFRRPDPVPNVVPYATPNRKGLPHAADFFLRSVNSTIFTENPDLLARAIPMLLIN